MKKFFKICLLSFALSYVMSSCYVHRYSVGEGAQTGVQVQGKNNFFIFGLARGKVTDPQQMAAGSSNFEVTEMHTFVDGLLAAITFGIYTPTTTKVQK